MPGNDGRKGWVVDMTGWSENSCIIKFIRFLMKRQGKNWNFSGWTIYGKEVHFETGNGY